MKILRIADKYSDGTTIPWSPQSPEILFAQDWIWIELGFYL